MEYRLASNSWDEKEIEAIQKVIDSGYYSMGERVKEFEKAFAQYTGSKYCVMVNSGSSANLLAVAALFFRKEKKLKRGDEVIVPAVSWATTYHPLQQYGLKVKFVDIDISTLNFDLNSLKKAVTDSTKMIFAVNLLGNPNDYREVSKIIEGRDIILLEDNCESMGATFDEQQTGTFGLMGTYSCFFSHHISTMEGGLIVTNDEEVYHILLSLRAHGWTRNLPKANKVCDNKYDNTFYDSFRFVLPGYNVRPIEMSGATGLVQLKKLPEFIKQRRLNAAFFVELFNNNPDFYIQKEIGNSSWFGFSLVIKPNSKLTRDTLVKNLQANGIEVRPIVAGNFVNNEVIKYYDYIVDGDLCNASYVHEQGIFVGNHHYSIREKIKYLYDITRKILY